MEMRNLELHNDLICCVDIDPDYVLSGRYSMKKKF